MMFRHVKEQIRLIVVYISFVHARKLHIMCIENMENYAQLQYNYWKTNLLCNSFVGQIILSKTAQIKSKHQEASTKIPQYTKGVARFQT